MIRYAIHADEMIESRELDRAWVEATVTAPDWTGADPGNPAATRSFRTIPEAGGKVLRVVHRPDDTDILVITAHFDQRASP